MVVKPEIEELGGFGELAGQLEVFFARGGIARGVVMDDDDAGRAPKEGRLEDFPRVDERGGEGPGGLRRGEFPGVKNLGTLKRTDICSSQR